jgi:hypothetical protein
MPEDNLNQQLSPIQPTPPKRRLMITVLVIVAVALLSGTILALTSGKKTKNGNNTAPQNNSSATTMFYSMLGNAAKQQKLRVAMYRETYANKADADAKHNIGVQTSSVSEVDTAAGKFRSVFVSSELQGTGKFNIGRCLDGITYQDDYTAHHLSFPSTLTEASTQLKLLPEGHLYQVTEPLVFITCPHLGILPSSEHIAFSRLSDGVFPVTLSDSEAAAWRQKVQAANLFTVTDEGTVTHDGKKLKKLSFTPKQIDGVNQQLYQIFADAGEITKIKSEHPTAEVDYEFLSINPFNSGSVGGFYLVDPQTNLPVYSELYGTNPDKQLGSSPSASKNIARTKQSYSYPDQLTIDINTPLEYLQ